MSASAASVLNDLADQVAAAANLDDAARRNVDFDLEVGDPEFAISDALLATRTPLPTPLLARIREGVNLGWYQDATRRLVLDALDRQERQNVA